MTKLTFLKLARIDRVSMFLFSMFLFALAQSPNGAAALEKINASYGAISGSMAQTWIAKEARLFEKYGLDLNLVYISGGPRSIMSLIGGSATPQLRVARSMLYLLSRSSPEVANVNPDGFIEARYVNELESSGFFDEMTRQYGK